MEAMASDPAQLHCVGHQTGYVRVYRTDNGMEPVCTREIHVAQCPTILDGLSWILVITVFMTNED